MKHLITTIILISILSLSSFAQVSGYLGKRHEVSYSYSTMYALYNRYERTNTDNYPMFYKRSTLSYSYTLSSKHKIGANIEFFKRHLLTPTLFFNDSYNDATTIREETFSFNIKSFGIDYYKYIKDWIAPYGTYVKQGLNVYFYKLDQQNFEKLYREEIERFYFNNNPHNINDIAFNGSIISYSLAIGIERIYFSSLSIDYGCQFSINTGYITVLSDAPYRELNESLEHELRSTLATSLIANIYIKAGFIF